jgi:hypothetical protein
VKKVLVWVIEKLVIAPGYRLGWLWGAFRSGWAVGFGDAQDAVFGVDQEPVEEEVTDEQ